MCEDHGITLIGRSGVNSWRVRKVESGCIIRHLRVKAQLRPECRNHVRKTLWIIRHQLFGRRFRGIGLTLVPKYRNELAVLLRSLRALYGATEVLALPSLLGWNP